MTRKLSLITAVGAAALTVGAPAAFGAVHANSEVAPVLAQPDPMIEDGFAQAVAKASVTGYRDAHDRSIVPNQSVVSDLNTYTPFDQARPATLSWSPEVARQVALARQAIETRGNLDAHERSAPGVGSTEVPSINTGREIEWPQIGFGLGIGLLLALGLGLLMRTVHIRPFAH